MAQVTSVPTPDDPRVDDGFYTLFSPAGTQVLTASILGGYAPDVASVGVLSGDTVLHDFHLVAGWLSSILRRLKPPCNLPTASACLLP